MNTFTAIAEILRTRLRQQGQTQADLRKAAGIAQRTLTNVLSGEQDFKVSTLLALADRLGLEMMLVPKSAAAAIDTIHAIDTSGLSAPVSARVPTRVEVARRQIGGKDK